MDAFRTALRSIVRGEQVDLESRGHCSSGPPGTTQRYAGPELTDSQLESSMEP